VTSFAALNPSYPLPHQQGEKEEGRGVRIEDVRVNGTSRKLSP